MVIQLAPAPTAPETSSVAPPLPAVRPERTWRVAEAARVAAIGLAALLLRWPNHQLMPAFTDETVDVYRGLLAARGQLFPLTDTSSYIGSLWDWLVAAAFLATGFSPAAPRTLALVF